MRRYVVGFAFDPELGRVALIEKRRPDWQRWRLNGVGGSIEAGELPIDAMRREFLEETGTDVPGWRQFCSLGSRTEGSWRVYFFAGVHPSLESVRSVTDEVVILVLVSDLACSFPGSVGDVWTLPNLRWLIPMAVSVLRGEERASMFEVVEL